MRLTCTVRLKTGSNMAVYLTLISVYANVQQINKNICYEKVSGILIGFEGNSGVKSKKTRSYHKGKCN